MTDREKLWYLINGLIKGTYEVKTFCSEFARIYNTETDYSGLTFEEHKEFAQLCKMVERFSDNKEELKIPNMYYCEKDVIVKVNKIVDLFEKQ